jgi:hypothetical protein
MKSITVLLQLLSDNFLLIVACVAAAAGLIIKIKNFLTQSKEEQKAELEAQAENLAAAIKAGLLSLVTLAEKKYGEKVGQLKQSDVFNEIVKAYPSITEYIESGLISTDFIKECIDEAVDEFNKKRSSNPSLENYVTTDEQEV